MNEWSRLADISTSTRRYLAKSEVQKINMDAAAKMARIHRARMRHATYTTAAEMESIENQPPLPDLPPPSDPMAVELPGTIVPKPLPDRRPGLQYPPPQQYQQVPSSDDKFTVISSDEFPQPVDNTPLPRRSHESRTSVYDFGTDPRSSNGSVIPSPRRSADEKRIPPPLPPKTPIPYFDGQDGRNGYYSPPRLGNGAPRLPYPDTDGPPPIVNMARKPQYSR